ncbi:SseB family protein [Yinghuangia soli]|uniref:SseB family protein n=1 Tax=Yinghuangia soli TaxID=2908204 RepID=A0AA41Q7R2_9ACTN|nr:SseB family protein [Yinghuangia soli]MCF2532296.1 SseB family protein [Yinghuangia soli]
MRESDFGMPPDGTAGNEVSGGGHEHGAAAELTAQVALLAAGDGDAAALVAALRRTRLYCVRLDRVGFAAMGPPGAQMVPVFTSEEQLAVFLGEGAHDWFSLCGDDLLDLLPPGTDLALDLGGPQPVRLHERMWKVPAGASAETPAGSDD